MRHNLIATAAAALSLVLLLATRTSEAGTGGREKARQATNIHVLGYTLTENIAYTIETTGLTAGADTVLHVLNRQNDAFIAGNDDCATTLSGCTGLRSFVQIPSTTTVRYVWIIVRAYGPGSAGSATLRIKAGTSAPNDSGISFNTGYRKTFASFANASHFLTTQEQGGTPDTVLLALSGANHRAIAYDDDDGVGNMSWIHVNEACSSGCAVIVATEPPLFNFPGANTAGPTTFIWDEDIHYSNCDTDGMSDSLEFALGTDRCNNDTDRDGIIDGQDLMGVDVASNLLRLPYYGSEPTQPDVFVEADWMECTPSNATDWTCGDPTSYDRDRWRMPTMNAAKVASFYYGPDVAVHIDTGLNSSLSGERFFYGQWGGASRQAIKNGDMCSWLSPDRVGFFHGARLEGTSGGGGLMPGRCFDTGYSADSFSHELGHNMNLSHGGKQSGSPDLNCKPNYKSIMSYAMIYDSTGSNLRFSRNEYAFPTLYPQAMDERLGLATTDPEKLRHLKGPGSSFGYTIDDATGAIDWNRDGRFSDGFVRAAPTWGWGTGGCEQSTYQMDAEVSRDRNTTALSWFPAQTLAGVTPRLYWFTRRESDGKIEYRHATSFVENCEPSPDPSSTCRTNWTPGVSTDATALTSSLGGPGAPAAAWYQDSAWKYKLVLVYADTAGKLRYQTLTMESGSFGFQEQWSSPTYVGSGAETVSGSPAIISLDGSVYVYAISNGYLKQWKLPPSGIWSAPETQIWSDGNPIVASFGIGTTHGIVKTSTSGTQHIVAAIPLQSPLGQVELAWKDRLTGRWTRLADDRWQTGKPFTRAQPGLAYVPFDNDANNLLNGRFYLAWNPTDQGGARRAVFFAQTEGNDDAPLASDRRLLWKQRPVFLQNTWAYASSNVTLLRDRSYDANLRASFTFDYNGSRGIFRSLSFYPIADGIFNNSIRDQNDYAVILSNLRCALVGGTCQ